MADAQSLHTRGSQSMQKDSYSRARAAPGPQRKPLLPRVQMHVWCFAARLCAAPAHRGSPGTDADHVRAPQLDCGQVRHVRSAALHALFPSHSRRDAVHVAPHSARRAENRLTLIMRRTYGLACARNLSARKAPMASSACAAALSPPSMVLPDPTIAVTSGVYPFTFALLKSVRSNVCVRSRAVRCSPMEMLCRSLVSTT